ncbi:MAG: VCBS repeat-containing protein [Planctomycetota bacterium]|nr:VCBS repeat-containing protein [Planctomycetota bacterium]
MDETKKTSRIALKTKSLIRVVPFLSIFCSMCSAEDSLFELMTHLDTKLSFRFENGSRGKFDLPEIMGGGVAAADFDGDQKLDLFFCQGGPIDRTVTKIDAPCQWYRNLGHMKFQEVKAQATGPAYAMGAWPADFDEDGKTDLFVTGWRGWKLYRNRGGWDFEDVSVQLGNDVLKWSTAAVWADFNHDQHLDLFVGGYIDYDSEKSPYCTAPDGLRDYCGPEDFDAVPSRLYFGDGKGHFKDVTKDVGFSQNSGRSLGAIAGDLNRDGRLDLFIAVDGNANQLYIQNKDGSFHDRALESGVAFSDGGQALASMGVTVAERDGGSLDLIVTNFYDRGSVLFQNQGDGLFQDISKQNGLRQATLKCNGFGVVCDDFDSDGQMDIVQVNGHVLSRERLGIPLKMRPSMLTIGLDGKYQERSSKIFPASVLMMQGRGLIKADFDEDGRIDLLITRLDGEPILLKNIAKRRSTEIKKKNRVFGGSYLSGVVNDQSQ